MNIKEHIDAGHYPVDDRGRALVPNHDFDGEVVVCATDHPGDRPIVGWYRRPGVDSYGIGSWKADDPVLSPPSPRKVKVTAWGVFSGTTFHSAWFSKATADDVAAGFKRWTLAPTVVELTGEYEEPWS